MKRILLLLLIPATLWAQAPTRLDGKVWAVEDQAVYITRPDGEAVKAPLSATFLRQNLPVAPRDLRTGEPITVLYPEDDFEILAGPYAPNAAHPYPHRTIRRGPTSLDQDFRDGRWQDR